jgi:hypothetical protein
MLEDEPGGWAAGRSEAERVLRRPVRKKTKAFSLITWGRGRFHSHDAQEPPREGTQGRMTERAAVRACLGAWGAAGNLCAMQPVSGRTRGPFAGSMP